MSTKGQIMTIQRKGTESLTDAEFDEMVALKNAINTNPATVVPSKLEAFTEYLVRSLREKGG